MSGVMLSARYGVPKALLEAGRRPVIVELLERLHAELTSAGWTPEYRIVVGPSPSPLRRFLSEYARRLPAGMSFSWRTQPRPDGPLDAVRRGLPASGPVLIWPADTMVMSPARWTADAVYARAGRHDPSRWALVEDAGDGKPRFLFKRAGPARRGLAFTGAALLADSALLRRCCGTSGEIHSALERYASARRLSVVRARSWVDAGSPDTFLKAKESLLERISTHRFSLRDGRVRKSMRARRDETTLRQSAQWFAAAARANPALRPSLPAPVTLRGSTLTLPYRDWPSLADWRLYRSLYLPRESAAAFAGFLGFVAKTLHAARAPSAAVRLEADRAMIVDKTRARMARVADRAMLREEHRLDGRRLPSWRTASRWLEDAAASLAPSRAEDWRSIHGDLVLSNALADGAGGFFLVDPRAAYAGAPPPFGNRHYDYAKIAQCVFSRYDEIKKDEFDLSFASGRARMSLPLATHPGRVRWERLLSAHARREGLDPARLRLIEASLLLGLLPFHQDRPRHVRAFYLLGLDLLARLRDGRLD